MDGPGANVAVVATADGTDLEALYRAHFDFVWRSLRRLGVEKASLDDAAQDVFLVVHRRLQDYTGGSAKAWLFAIAQRVASDHRRRVRRKGGLLPLDERVASAGRDGPLAGALRHEASGIVMEFLQDLDDDRRAAFILAELEQMTAPEIGQALGVNVSTVYSRIASARGALVQFVTERHPDALEGRR